MKRRLLTALAAVVGALVGGELLLVALGLPDSSGRDIVDFRATGRHVVADDALFWRLAPEGSAYQVNRLGLRGWLPPEPKRPNDYRIACVGDSCSFGLGVRYEEAYGMQLERALQLARPDTCVQAILAGLPGYSSYQSRMLYESSIAAFSPDLTIVYCGAWNDYVPAIGVDDATRARRASSLWYRLRIVRMLERALRRDLSVYEHALETGQAPDGRRVEIPDYRANLEAIARRAESISSALVFVVAASTDENARKRPIARDYARVTREVAERHSAPIVDAPRLFAQRRDGLSAEWLALGPGEWPCLTDSIHPTTTGHRIIAEELARIVEESEWTSSRAGSPPPEGLRVSGVEPSEVPAFGATRLSVRGERLSEVERVWLGDTWIRSARATREDRIELTLPRIVPPGSHELVLGTAHGIVRSGLRVEVQQPLLHATLERSETVASVVFEMLGPGGWKVGIWYGTTQRDRPQTTQFGPFWLDDRGRPPNRDDGPFRWDRLTLPHSSGQFDGQGRWTQRIDWSVDDARELPRELVVQALALDAARPGYGVLSVPAAVRIER